MKEWHRTVILIIFLIILVGLLVWSRQVQNPVISP